MVPAAEESVVVPTPTPQLTDGSNDSPSLDGTASLPVPALTGMTEGPRRLTRDRVPAPSREETNDGLRHGRKTMQALEQVCEASSRRTTAKVDAVTHPLPDLGEEDSHVETAEGPPGGVTNEIVLLVDVEDPDAPSWSEALGSSERDNWLEGAKAELTSLHEMGVYQLVSRCKVPTNCSILRRKFVCRLKRNELGVPVRYKV